MLLDRLLLFIFSFLLGYICCYFGKYTELRHHYEQLESMLNGGGVDD